MGNINRTWALILIGIIAISSLLTVQSANAQTTPKPSVPEFTLNYINSSYYAPLRDGYVNNSTIQIIIKNQPYGTYTDNGYPVKMYYNVRFNVLTASTYIENGVNYTKEGGWSIPIFGHSTLQEASDGQYTVIEIQHQEGGWNASGNTHLGLPWNSYLLGLQVRAELGSIQKDPFYPPSLNFEYFYGQTSDWSDTQTLTIPDTNAIPGYKLRPSPTPTAPESRPFLILTVTIIVAFVLISSILLLERHRKTSNLNK